jgi:tRNA modification GTPase
MERLGGEDIAVWVVDASRALDALDGAMAERFPSGAVIVLNKTDLPRRTGLSDGVARAERKGVPVLARAEMSAATGGGLPELRKLLARLAGETAAAAEWTRREGAELRLALGHCRAAAEELAGAGRLELAADDLRGAAEAFSRALGEGYAEEALTRIFSAFCIGK